MKHPLLAAVLLLAAAVASADDFASYKPVKKEKLVLGCGFEDPAVLKHTPFKEECSIVRGAGVNGNTGLVIERKKTALNREIFMGLLIPDTVPGTTYRVEITVRQEGLKKVKEVNGFYTYLSVESSYKDTGKGVPWRDGSFHCMVKGAPAEYKTTVFRFTAKPNMNHSVILRFHPGWVGKLFFDDLKVYSEGVKGTALLVYPSAHTFGPDSGRFRVKTYALPENAEVQARLLRSGKVLKQMMLKPEGDHFFGGDLGKISAGEGMLEIFAAVPAKKELLVREAFPVHFRKTKLPVKGTVTFDEKGRMIVDGKLFMPVSISSDFDPVNFKRIADAGFNLLNTFQILRNPGCKDHSKYFDPIRQKMDEAWKHHLYLTINTSIFLDFYRWRIRKIRNAESQDDKVALAVRELGNHPANFCYYVSDEVPGEFLHQVIRMRRQLNELDPAHPTMTLSNDPKLLPAFAASGDIFCGDSYPIGKKDALRDLSEISTFMARMRLAGVPLFGYAQAFSWGHYFNNDTPEKYARFASPTMEEMRSMTLLFAIEGAKGFFFYTDPYKQQLVKQSKEFKDPGYPERMWSRLLPVIKELKEMEPYIMGGKDASSAKVEKIKGTVAARAFRSDAGKTALFIVAVKGPACEAIITLPGCPSLKSRHGKTENLGNGRYRFRAISGSSDILLEK